ncbi:MAG: ABC transporter permease [Anaerolineales bacterium]
MKKLLAIAWKDTLLRFTSPAEWLFFIVLPIIFTFLLAGGTPGEYADPRIRLVVVDEAGTDLSAQIIRELEDSTAVRPELVTRAEAEQQFNERRALVVFFIPPGLSLEALQAGTAEVELLQQPNNVNATVAQRAIQTALRRVSSAVSAANMAVAQREKQQPFASEAEHQAYFDEALRLAAQLQAEAPQRVTVVEGAVDNQVDYDPRANASAGQLITWVFIPLFGISELFAFERSQGTLRRLLTTPTRRATYLFGTISGQVMMAIVQMLLLVVFGMTVMGLQWGRDPAALAVMLVTSALAAAAIGTAMGTFVKSAGQANGLSIMMGMVMALMGGCWYPLELFPPAVQTAVHALPTTWAMQGMLDLVLRGRGLVDVLPEAGMLLGFAALFFAIGVWRFRYE